MKSGGVHANTGQRAANGARLADLKAQPRQPGEASFFWYETHFRCEAVKLLPGEYFVDCGDILIMTTLGSCIAACLWDSSARIGGMNHFMLPEGEGDARYGSYAMELLINEMMKKGASRSALEAKVFGGGRVMTGTDSLHVGERNTRFVLEYLRAEGIPIVSSDVLDVYPRKVCFQPLNGKAMVKRLGAIHAAALLADESAAARTKATTGSVDLF